MAWHGSNVDLAQREELERQLDIKYGAQDKVLAEYDELSRSLADLEEKMVLAMAAVPTGGLGAHEAERARKRGAHAEVRRLRFAEERVAFCRAAIDVLKSQVSNLQSRAAMLRAQIGIDGGAK